MQVCDGTLKLLLLLQVVAFQLLPEAAADPVHEATGTFVVLLGVQVVDVQLLPEVAADAVQVCT